MKLFLVVAVIALAAVTIDGKICSNMDPSTCTHTCPEGEVKACEHGVCTCAASCKLASDCADCPSHTMNGHTIHEQKHCVDGGCICTMPMPPGNHPPGDQP